MVNPLEKMLKPRSLVNPLDTFHPVLNGHVDRMIEGYRHISGARPGCRYDVDGPRLNSHARYRAGILLQNRAADKEDADKEDADFERAMMVKLARSSNSAAQGIFVDEATGERVSFAVPDPFEGNEQPKREEQEEAESRRRSSHMESGGGDMSGDTVARIGNVVIGAVEGKKVAAVAIAAAIVVLPR
jgi:hypothetical protein